MPKSLERPGPCEEKYWWWRGVMCDCSGAVRQKQNSKRTVKRQKEVRSSQQQHTTVLQQLVEAYPAVHRPVQQYYCSSSAHRSTAIGRFQQYLMFTTTIICIMYVAFFQDFQILAPSMLYEPPFNILELGVQFH